VDSASDENWLNTHRACETQKRPRRRCFSLGLPVLARFPEVTTPIEINSRPRSSDRAGVDQKEASGEG